MISRRLLGKKAYDGDMNLTRLDRLLLINQYRILEALYPDEAVELSGLRKALESGYKLHYEWNFTNVADNEMSEQDSEFVLEVLQMYRCLHDAYNNHKGNLGDVAPDKLRFPGFDANEESQLYGYARYFLSDLDRYVELRGDSAIPDFNSHWPMRSTYQSMLSAWSESSDKYSLTVSDFQRIMGARNGL
jgi:uncharacterized protein YfbU (UPF0304 family)